MSRHLSLSLPLRLREASVCACRGWPEPDNFWKSQLSLPTTAQPQHSRPLYLAGHALEAYWRAPDTQVVARKRVSRVSRNAPLLPSKQAHAHSPSGANFQPPFICFDGYGLNLNPSGNKRIGEIRTKTRISTPMPLLWQGNGTNLAPHSHPWP